MNEIKITWHGTDITYSEDKNRWVYTLRSRERSSESLELAKQAIDKPEPKEKVPFERVKCYMKNYSDKFKVVEVTSIAESGMGSPSVWVLDGKDRSKERPETLYPVNPQNDALVHEWLKLKAQYTAIGENMYQVMQKMDRLQIPKESN